MKKESSNLSFWLAEALADNKFVAANALKESVSADVCIVGGGFTGLWSSIEIKRRAPETRVVLIDRGICGSGASGRNGGLVLSLWAKFASMQKLCGTDEAVRLAKASEDAVRYIGEFCEEHSIDADYRLNGWLWAATSQPQVGTWSETQSKLEALGLNRFQSLSRDDVVAMSGSERHLAGAFEAVSGCVQPAKLVLGLRRVALELGVDIYENTTMQELKRGKKPSVVCPKGTITANKVIIALNAWGICLSEIRKAIAVVSSDVVVTPPIPDKLAELGWTNGMSISDSRILVQYSRTTADGRIVFGKGGGSGKIAFGRNVDPGFDGPSPIADVVKDCLYGIYPSLKGTGIAQSWTGPIDRSNVGLPIFGRLSDCPNVLYGVGYSGNGVGPSVLGGRILSSLALEARDEWSECGLVKPLKRAFPPEPFRYVGSKLVQTAIAKQDKAHDRNTTPNLVVRGLVSLAPAGLSPVGRPQTHDTQ